MHKQKSVTKDLKIGDVFNKLTIKSLYTVKSNSRLRIMVLCYCECGNEKPIRADNVVTGRTKSCGCVSPIAKGGRLIGFNDIEPVWFNKVAGCARKRNLEFNITMQDLWEVWEKQNRKCALTGEELVWPGRISYAKIKTTVYGTASIDRIDSSKGYLKDNIQIVHKYINLMKLDHHINDFIDMCTKVAKFCNPNLEIKTS